MLQQKNVYFDSASVFNITFVFNQTEILQNSQRDEIGSRNDHQVRTQDGRREVRLRPAGVLKKDRHPERVVQQTTTNM